jgi:hypothetical protein
LLATSVSLNIIGEIAMIKNTSASQKYKVGHGYEITFEVKDRSLNVTWFPDFPPKKRLQRILSSGQYFAARNAYLADLADQLRGSVLCIDL